MGWIELEAGLWKAKVLPSCGANLAELFYDNRMILRPPADLAQLRQSPYLYGNPFLLPPNRTRDGRFTFEGRVYELPINEEANHNHIHGQMHDAEFSVEDSTQRELWCRYENKGERYPFPFTVVFHYELSENGLLLEIRVRNDGEGRMPLLIGFHTTFAEPETFAVPVGKRWERDERFLPTGELIELGEREKRIRNGRYGSGEPLSGYYTAKGHRARVGEFFMETSEKFGQWVLFNGGGKDGYLCVEPQSGPVNGLNMPGMYQALEKGEMEEYWIRFHRKRGKETVENN